MPANKKYLTTSVHQRIAKISAAIPGAFFVSATLHMAAAQWLGDYKTVVSTFSFLTFPVWIVLMILPFLFYNGWKCLALYLGLIALFVSLFIAGQSWHPIAI